MKFLLIVVLVKYLSDDPQIILHTLSFCFDFGGQQEYKWGLLEIVYHIIVNFSTFDYFWLAFFNNFDNVPDQCFHLSASAGHT